MIELHGPRRSTNTFGTCVLIDRAPSNLIPRSLKYAPDPHHAHKTQFRGLCCFYDQSRSDFMAHAVLPAVCGREQRMLHIRI